MVLIAAADFLHLFPVLVVVAALLTAPAGIRDRLLPASVQANICLLGRGLHDSRRGYCAFRVCHHSVVCNICFVVHVASSLSKWDVVVHVRQVAGGLALWCLARWCRLALLLLWLLTWLGALLLLATAGELKIEHAGR